jgi:hypothetical protein
MTRRMSLLAAVAALALIPLVAQARGYRRGGYVITPYGRMNTNSPEYRMAGGNPMVYQQLMQQKLMMQRQQMLMKQQLKYMQQMQKKQKSQSDQPTQQLDSNVTSLAPSKKKKRTYVPQSQQKAAAEKKAADKTDSTATKP